LLHGKSRCNQTAAIKRDPRTQVIALAKTLPERDLEAARRYLEYLRDFGDAELTGPADVERAWTAELRSRIDALEAGKTQGEDWTKVRARMKRGARA